MFGLGFRLREGINDKHRETHATATTRQTQMGYGRGLVYRGDACGLRQRSDWLLPSQFHNDVVPSEKLCCRGLLSKNLQCWQYLKGLQHRNLIPVQWQLY